MGFIACQWLAFELEAYWLITETDKVKSNWVLNIVYMSKVTVDWYYVQKLSAA